MYCSGEQCETGNAIHTQFTILLTTDLINTMSETCAVDNEISVWQLFDFICNGEPKVISESTLGYSNDFPRQRTAARTKSAYRTLQSPGYVMRACRSAMYVYNN